MATNKPRRKTYSDEFKEFLVQEAISSGRSIASIARDNGINQNLLHNWKREQKAKQAQTDQIPALIDNDAYRNTPTFIPVSLQPKPNHEQITDFITSRSSVLTGIELQIPSHNAMPIKLTIDQIDTHSLPHCQNSCHPHLNNPNGEKGDNHGTIQCRTQTGYTKQTFIT